MAKSASPCRVRQHPPEARCCTFTGRTSRPGRTAALLRRSPFRTGRARFPGISAQASPRGSWAGRSAGGLLAVLCPPIAARVEETLLRLVRWVLSGVDDRLFGDRLAGGPQPLLPFVRALWLVVGVQEEPGADRTAAVLLAEQSQDGQLDRRGCSLASPLGPVGGQGGVVGGRRAFDQVVPDDRCPGEPVQVGTAVAVAEHPPVVPGRVELAEVAVDDPPFRLVRVAKQCPPVEQGPPVAVQLVERLGGHHAAVEGRELAR